MPRQCFRHAILPISAGARFEFRGQQFQNMAMSMAENADRIAHIFQGVKEVTPIGEPQRSGAEVDISTTLTTSFWGLPGQG